MVNWEFQITLGVLYLLLDGLVIFSILLGVLIDQHLNEEGGQ